MKIFKSHNKTPESIVEEGYIMGDSGAKLRESPFQGPTAFLKNDKDWFFGRDEESEEILSLILGHKCILIYAKSGAGKSSLLNAKIISDLEEKGLGVLPVARIGSAFIGNSLAAPNPYMSNALEEIIKDESLPIEAKFIPTNITLSQFIKYFIRIKEKKHSDSKQVIRQKPYVIIFDQLEEIFNLYPDNWRLKQHDFFEQIASALDMDDLRVRVVLVIREDYVANLDSYSEILPEKLRQRIRIELLTKEQANEAIEKPLEKAKNYYADTNINERIDYLLNTKVETVTQQLESKSLLDKVRYSLHLKKDTPENKFNEDNTPLPQRETESLVEKVINNLSSVRIETPEGKTADKVGDFVEPIYLQVVCDKLWKKLILSKRTEINPQFLEKLGNVDNALEELYVDAIHDAASSKLEVSQDSIRDWLEKKLITPNDTRGSAYKDPSKKDKIPEEALKVLENKYLIRVDRRPSGRWYELTHDRLIKPIKKSNKERRDHVTKRNYYFSVAVSVIISIAFLGWYFSQSDPPPPEVHALGTKPSFIAVDDEDNKVYVSSSSGSNNISVINGKTNKVIDTIELGYQPKSLDIHPQKNKLYVSSYNSSNITVIDSTTNTVIDSTTNQEIDPIILDYIPGNIAVNTNTNEIYVIPHPLSESKDKVLVFENFTSLKSKQKSIIPVSSLYKIKVDPNTNKVYIFSNYYNSISIFDGKTDKVIDNIELDQILQNIFFNPSTNTIYVESKESLYSDDKYLTLIDGKTNDVIGNGSIPLPTNSSTIAINPTTNLVYAANYGFDDNSTISVINITTNKVITDIPVSISPDHIAVNPYTNLVYFFNTFGYDANTISVINGTTNNITNVEKIELEYTPISIFTDLETNTTYIGARDSDFNHYILFLNSTTNKIDDSIPISIAPRDIAIHPSTNTIYVSGKSPSSSSNYLIAINGTTSKIIDSREIDSHIALAINPNTNKIYLGYPADPNENKNKITVINGTTNKVKNSIELNYVPGNIAVNTNTSEIYVTPINNYETGNATLTVINSKTNELVDNIELDYIPTDISINPNTNKIYLAVTDITQVSNKITVIDGKTKQVDSILLRDTERILGMMINPITNDIYVYDSDSVSIINAKSEFLDADIFINENLYDLAFDARDQKIYVSDYDSDTVYVVNGEMNGIEAIVTTGNKTNSFRVGYDSIEMVNNPEKDIVYVLNKDFVSVVNSTTNELTETIDLTNEFTSMYTKPNSISIDPNTNTIYVESKGDSLYSDDKYLTLIDGKTNDVIGNGSIPLPTDTSAIAINPTTNRTYIAYYDTNDDPRYIDALVTSNISVINGITYEEIVTNKKIDIIELSKGSNVKNLKSSGIAFNPHTNTVYVSNNQSNKNLISVVNSTTNEVMDIIELDYTPTDISIDPSTNTIYVESKESLYSDDKYLTLIDGKTNDVIGNGSIPLPTNSSTIAINPTTNLVYAANYGFDDNSTISVINITTNKVITDIPVSISPDHIAVNPYTNLVYFFNTFGYDAISVINGKTNKVIDTIELDHVPRDIFFNPSTNTIYVESKESLYSDDKYLTLIDGKTNDVIGNGSIPLPTGAYDIAINPTTNLVYVFSDNSNILNDYANTISVINGTTYDKDRIDLVKGSTLNKLEPHGVAINPSTNTIYTFDYLYSNGTNISVINGKTNKVIDTIELDHVPRDIFFNPSTNTIYVESKESLYSDDKYLTLIDGKTNDVIGNGSIPLPTGAYDIAINPTTNLVYAFSNAFRDDNSILSVINITTNEVITDIPVSISDIAINPTTNTIYAFNTFGYDANTISVINGTTNNITNVEKIELEYTPISIFTDLETNTTYIGARDSDFNHYILFLNSTTNKIDDSIPISIAPRDIAINPTNNTIYAFNTFGYDVNTISVINGTFEEVDKFELDHVVDSININPTTNLVYAANYGFDGNSTISVINGTTNEFIESIHLDQRYNNTDIDPYIPSDFDGKDITINPHTNTIYVSGESPSSSSNYLIAINGTTSKIIDSKDINPILNNTDIDPYIPSDFKPKDMFVDPHTNTIYVSGESPSSSSPSSSSNYLLAINGTTTNKIIDTIELDIAPKKMIMDFKSNVIYILEDTEYYSSGVRILDISNPSDLNLLSPIKMTTPIDLTLDSEHNRIFVAHKEEREENLFNSPLLSKYSISVLNAKTYEKLGEIKIETIQKLAAIQYDENNVYVLDTKTNSISTYTANIS